MAIKMLNLVENLGQYKRLENGARFFHNGREIDIRKISEADADALAADPSCSFLGKEGVTKQQAAPASVPATSPGKKAGDATMDASAAKSPAAPKEK